MAPFATEESDEEKVKPWRLERVPNALVAELEGFVLYRSSPINRQRGIRIHHAQPCGPYSQLLVPSWHRWDMRRRVHCRGRQADLPRLPWLPQSRTRDRTRARRLCKGGAVVVDRSVAACARGETIAVQHNGELCASPLHSYCACIAVTGPSHTHTHRRYELAHQRHELCIQHVQDRRHRALRPHHATGRATATSVRIVAE
jgi:hypothetical protein